MSYEHSQYQSVRLGTPGSDQVVQAGVLDYANSETITLAATDTAENATALPAGCYMARIASGTSQVRYRADGTAADANSPPIPAGTVDGAVVVTAATRVISLYGTSGDTITITPYLTSYRSVADQA